MKCRDFLSKANFKQVIDIRTPLIVKKIHLAYRGMYIRDTLFAKEEQTVYQSLQHLIFQNTIDILTHFINNVTYMESVVEKAQTSNVLEEQTDAL